MPYSTASLNLRGFMLTFVQQLRCHYKDFLTLSICTHKRNRNVLSGGLKSV